MGNILVGIIFIIGGLSGKLVLRGTNSSGALVVVGIILVIWGIYKASKDGASSGAAPVSGQQQTTDTNPQIDLQGSPDVSGFERYNSAGVCDVCNCGLNAGDGYMVPVDTFYQSAKYKEWLANNPSTKAAVDSYGGVENYLSNMRANDQTSHSVVCPNCASLFSSTANIDL